jgi:hypothetical protein
MFAFRRIAANVLHPPAIVNLSQKVCYRPTHLGDPFSFAANADLIGGTDSLG